MNLKTNTNLQNSILVFISFALSLSLSNSAWAHPWQAIQHNSWLHLLSHDIGMTAFFFAIGNEIRHEENTQQLWNGIWSAIGGVIAPALIYMMLLYLLNAPKFAFLGWAIPTATDIQLGLSVLACTALWRRYHHFFKALAIIDDIIAIFIMALFYQKGLSYSVLLLLFVFPLQKISTAWFKPLTALFILWVCWNSGLHGALAGIILSYALHLPPIPKIDHVIQSCVPPFFILLNTSIQMSGAHLNNPVFIAIMTSMCFGKPLGILGARWIVARIQHKNTPWREWIGVAFLTGIGCTVSLLITELAFANTAFEAISKLGVLYASMLSAIIGYMLIRFSVK